MGKYRELARLLGGKLAGTRPVCDRELLPVKLQVGQSGVMIKPKLYLGFGISGAVNHVTGVDADMLIAVNTDKTAPIFNYCDYGIVGDMDEVCDELIGLPVLRLKSDYLAIATLGFAEILRAFFQWKGLGVITNGSNLLRKYTAFSDMKLQIGSQVFKLSTTFPFLIAMISIIIIVLLINSSYGRAFKAIRDDEVAAEAMGINLFKHKMLSFVISAFFAGVGGALLAMFQTAVQASTFTSVMTYEILLIVVIGGIGSVSGSCIAAFLYIACSEWWLRFLDSGALPFGNIQVSFFRDGFRMVVFSVVIMIIVLFFSKGIMGNKELSFAGLIKKIKAKKAAKAEKVKEGGAA